MSTALAHRIVVLRPGHPDYTSHPVPTTTDAFYVEQATRERVRAIPDATVEREAQCHCRTWVRCVSNENICPTCYKAWGIGGGFRGYSVPPTEQRKRVEAEIQRELQKQLYHDLKSWDYSERLPNPPGLAGQIEQEFGRRLLEADPGASALGDPRVLAAMPEVRSALLEEAGYQQQEYARLRRRMEKAVRKQVARVMEALADDSIPATAENIGTSGSIGD